MKDILVIGDSCRDVYVYCESNRLAPDVPVPVLNVLYQNENGGMASNVFRNIQPKVPGVKLVTNQNWYSITKTRYVHKGTNHTFFRVDSSQEIKRIDVKSLDLDYKIIVVSDYDKGFLMEEDIEYICSKNSNVFIDSKKILGSWASEAKYIKINSYEYGRSKNFITKDLEEKIICTAGENGCNFKGKNYPVNKVEVIDVSGAGDSFMAGLVIEYLKSGDIEQSIGFANDCSSSVVQHPGVTIIDF
jgi:D-beta-D-heptose 7-phosphate kinase/D-beta-D-heptose 1-phosphate adenosyltransferase